METKSFDTKEFLKEKNINCDFATTPFTKETEREKIFDSNKHTVRSVSDNEILIEIDFDSDLSEDKLKEYRKETYRLQDRNYDVLKANGFEVYYFDHEGRSPYLRLYNVDFNKEKRKEQFRSFIEKNCLPIDKELFPTMKYDDSFYGGFHWCPIEGQKHWKYDKTHKFICFHQGNNSKIKIDLQEKSTKKKGYQTRMDILHNLNPTTYERTSLIGKLITTYNYIEDEENFVKTLSEYIEKNNKWKNYNKDITEKKIRDLTLNRKQKFPILNNIRHPSTGKLISKFAREVAEIIKDTNVLFYRVNSKDIVEIGKICSQKTGEELFTGFITIKPNRFVTIIEDYFTPTVLVKDPITKEYKDFPKSISSELANTVINSSMLQTQLPQIERIFTIPLPILYEGKLTFPEKGYDERFSSWLPYDSPTLTNPNMTLEDAKKIIEEIFKEFCFQTKQDYYNAVAGLLTPYLRGLFTKFNVRTPIFFYLANRERAGKDYCAGISSIVYEGIVIEEPAISTSENQRSNNTDELRKKILSAMMQGRKRLHFSNNKGFINNTTFEMVTTASNFSDRVLGRNDILTFENEIDYSLSGNVGVTYTADFANRCRFVRLFLAEENANERKFIKPDLHGWIKENRSIVISALYSLVRNWIENGSPKGTLPFASFQEWASICGGIMETAGYGNPCVIDKEFSLITGDTETNDMKRLFETCYEKYPEKQITRNEIKEIASTLDSSFATIDFNQRSGQTQFGLLLAKYKGRILSDIQMKQSNDAKDYRTIRHIFTKEKVGVNEKIF